MKVTIKKICQKWDSNPRPHTWTRILPWRKESCSWVWRLRPLGHPDFLLAQEDHGLSSMKYICINSSEVSTLTGRWVAHLRCIFLFIASLLQGSDNCFGRWMFDFSTSKPLVGRISEWQWKMKLVWKLRYIGKGFKTNAPLRGIEPRPRRWKRRILATRPQGM